MIYAADIERASGGGNARPILPQQPTLEYFRHTTPLDISPTEFSPAAHFRDGWEEFLDP